jgi:hypothetical protein
MTKKEFDKRYCVIEFKVLVSQESAEDVLVSLDDTAENLSQYVLGVGGSGTERIREATEDERDEYEDYLENLEGYPPLDFSPLI